MNKAKSIHQKWRKEIKVFASSPGNKIRVDNRHSDGRKKSGLHIAG